MNDTPSQKLAWDEICDKYPCEWVLLQDCEFAPPAIKSAVVVAHSTDRCMVALAKEDFTGHTTLWYTGHVDEAVSPASSSDVFREGEELHALYHRFCNRFKTPDWKSYRVLGYELMEQVEEFIVGAPEIAVAGCDDTTHSSSMIVLIPHKSETRYFGTTFVFIPQHDGQPTELSLGVEEVDGLMLALRKMQRIEGEYGPFGQGRIGGRVR